MHRWAAWHLHLATLDLSAQDRVVADVVGPAVDWLRVRDATTEWFFVRYWQHGPHIRFRVADLAAGEAREMDRLLRALMVATPQELRLTAAGYRIHVARMAAAGEGGKAIDIGALWPAGVYRQPYGAETERYGGKGLLSASESLFVTASELALAFTRLRPPDSARAGLGLQATIAALQVLPDEDRRLRFCQQSAAGWLRWAGIEDPEPPGAVLTGELAERIRSATAHGPVRRWADRLGGAFSRWLAAGTELTAERILHSHIHMLHNRLGLGIGDELAHYQALAEVLAAPVVPVGS